MSYEHLKTDSTVNFNTKTSVLKTEYKAVKVLAGSVSASIAMTLQDVKTLHTQVKPYIEGLPNSYTDYPYVIIEQQSGQKEVIGLPWIKESSITVSEMKNYQLILDRVEPEQVEIIRQALVNRGVTIRSFTTFEQ